jgi:hypothetical protein
MRQWESVKTCETVVIFFVMADASDHEFLTHKFMNSPTGLDNQQLVTLPHLLNTCHCRVALTLLYITSLYTSTPRPETQRPAT